MPFQPCGVACILADLVRGTEKQEKVHLPTALHEYGKRFSAERACRLSRRSLTWRITHLSAQSFKNLPCWSLISRERSPLWSPSHCGSGWSEELVGTWRGPGIRRGTVSRLTPTSSSTTTLLEEDTTQTFSKAWRCVRPDSAEQIAAELWLCHKNKHRIARVVPVRTAAMRFRATPAVGQRSGFGVCPRTPARGPRGPAPPASDVLMAFPVGGGRAWPEVRWPTPPCLCENRHRAGIVEHRLHLRGVVQRPSPRQSLGSRLPKVTLVNAIPRCSSTVHQPLIQNPLAFLILMNSQKQTCGQILEDII